MRRKIFGRAGVSPIIGSILMVAITVILVSSLWVMLNNVVPQFSGNPSVSLETQSAGLQTDQLIILIAGNQLQSRDLGMYSILIIRNNTFSVISSTPVKVGLIKSGTDGTKAYFLDDGNVLFNAGDRFLLDDMLPGSYYEFLITYNGQAVGQTLWNT